MDFYKAKDGNMYDMEELMDMLDVQLPVICFKA